MNKKDRLIKEIKTLEFDISHDEKVASSLKKMINIVPPYQKQETQKAYKKAREKIDAAKNELKAKRRELNNL